MIPKIIHYCWFGRGKKSELVERCIASWKKYLPDYQIIEWNEDNFDIHLYKYTEQAYQAKKWAFVSDVARLWALYEVGGIYLDTDMELFQPIDSFLNTSFFSGFESKDFVACGIIGSEKKNSIIESFLDFYRCRSFMAEDGSYDMVTNPHVLTPILVKNGLVLNGKQQSNMNFSIYPQNCFYPNTFGMIFGNIPQEAIAVHHSEKSWNEVKNSQSLLKRFRRYFVGILRNLIGTTTLEKIRDRK